MHPAHPNPNNPNRFFRNGNRPVNMPIAIQDLAVSSEKTPGGSDIDSKSIMSPKNRSLVQVINFCLNSPIFVFGSASIEASR
jgi:hypothetical protein